MKMKMLSTIAIAAAALSMSAVSSAAISGSTDFRVILPEVLVLYHWDDALLTLTDVDTDVANNSDTGREISDDVTREGTIELGATTATLTGDVAVTESAAALNTVAVTLQNSWAVRSLSSANGVELVLSTENSTLTHIADTDSTVEISKAVLVSTDAKVTGGSETTSLNIDSGWTPVLGDITFDLNLSGANSAGEYNTHGAAGADLADTNPDVFLMTLTGL